MCNLLIINIVFVFLFFIVLLNILFWIKFKRINKFICLLFLEVLNNFCVLKMIKLLERLMLVFLL